MELQKLNNKVNDILSRITFYDSEEKCEGYFTPKGVECVKNWLNEISNLVVAESYRVRNEIVKLDRKFHEAEWLCIKHGLGGELNWHIKTSQYNNVVDD